MINVEIKSLETFKEEFHLVSELYGTILLLIPENDTIEYIKFSNGMIYKNILCSDFLDILQSYDNNITLLSFLEIQKRNKSLIKFNDLHCLIFSSIEEFKNYLKQELLNSFLSNQNKIFNNISELLQREMFHLFSEETLNNIINEYNLIKLENGYLFM